MIEKQVGEHAPPTQPLGPPSLSTGEMQLLKPKRSAPAHWLTSVQAPPDGVLPLLPPHRPRVQVFAAQFWQVAPPRPQIWFELPLWQVPKVSQHPLQLPGPQPAL
jgi:hypothetical protein